MSIAMPPYDEDQISVANRHLSLPEDTIRAFCRKWNIRAFRFYGSIMRDDFRPDSDIDILVEFSPDAKPSFFDLGSMQEELEAILCRKVDLADRQSVDRIENYIRRKGMLSGKPPVLRQMSYLLDMLICARAIVKIAGNNMPEIIDSDEIAFHALSYNVRWLTVSAGRVDIPTREKLPEIPWEILRITCQMFEDDPFNRDKQTIKEIAWVIAPSIIPLLVAIIPPEDEV
jgi:predicted nucleotidyltransferase/uncharacterized protein with HEPN domain